MRWPRADEIPRRPSAPPLRRSSFPRRPEGRRSFPVPLSSWFPLRGFLFASSGMFFRRNASPEIPPINKNARELLASRAASKSWKDGLLRLRILGSQGGPRRHGTRGRALHNRNSLEKWNNHYPSRVNQLLK